MTDSAEKIEKIQKIAGDILNALRNTLIIKLRFMDKAISMLDYIPIQKTSKISVDGKHYIL